MAPKTCDVTCQVQEIDAKRLREAGFAPVIRWVDVANRSDVPLKTIEALTLLDRRALKGARATVVAEPAGKAYPLKTAEKKSQRKGIR